MSASVYFDSVYGASQTRFAGVTNGDLKSVDDITTSAMSAPITRGNRSYRKHISLRFRGSWTSILGAYAVRVGNPISNALLKGCATISYQGSTTGALGGTVISGTSSGSTIGPSPTFRLGLGASEGSATFLAASNQFGLTMLSNFLVYQLQTTPSTPASSIASNAFRIIIEEN